MALHLGEIPSSPKWSTGYFRPLARILTEHHSASWHFPTNLLRLGKRINRFEGIEKGVYTTFYWFTSVYGDKTKKMAHSNLCRGRLEFIGLLSFKSNRKDNSLSLINITYPQGFRTDPFLFEERCRAGRKTQYPVRVWRLYTRQPLQSPFWANCTALGRFSSPAG